MTSYAPHLRETLNEGASLEEALANLRAVGATPVASIKAIREVLGVSLGEAKVLFDASPAWQLEVEASRHLQEQLFRLLEGERK